MNVEAVGIHMWQWPITCENVLITCDIFFYDVDILIHVFKEVNGIWLYVVHK